MNYRITLAYDGTDYCGWQVQRGRPTIQGLLNEVLQRLEGAPVTSHGAGRTDTGVHAEGQVVSFCLTREWEGQALRRALNGNLPPEIRVLEAEAVTERFNARFDARSKTYRYQLYTAEVMSPFLDRYAWHYPYSLDWARLRADGEQLLGTHDFMVFTVEDCETKTRVRTLSDFRVEGAGPLRQIFFSGNGFLRYQVRTMVSALVEINRGRLGVSSITELLHSQNRKLVGAPAPAKGLTLVKVEY
jgi:tRNA pseudouridine38-40 synthase